MSLHILSAQYVKEEKETETNIRLKKIYYVYTSPIKDSVAEIWSKIFSV